jgi:hypothetical protein
MTRAGLWSQVIMQARALVAQAAAGEFVRGGPAARAQDGAGAGGIPARPGLEQLQRAVVLRLQMVSAAMAAVAESEVEAAQARAQVLCPVLHPTPPHST